MEKISTGTYNIYKDISARTNGDIYIGVVGPVRTGKSTFIKRFMDVMVLPEMEDAHSRERATDELPQSAQGKTCCPPPRERRPAGAGHRRAAAVGTG